MKDTNFYNKESVMYSAKRYPQKPVTFTQFFFKDRLAKTLAAVGEYAHITQRRLSLLEIGCADGIVVRALWERYKTAFSAIDATDISPGMIEVAQKNNADTSIHFSVRDEAELLPAYDLVIEIGVLNYTDLETDLKEVAEHLATNGQYICSIAGNSSIEQKLKADTGYLHLRSYRDYEQELEKCFTVVRTIPVGYFVPLLWKLPVVARVLQPIFEVLGRNLVPNLAHEKLYVLAPKSHA